jgi:hypothetical protein
MEITRLLAPARGVEAGDARRGPASGRHWLELQTEAADLAAHVTRGAGEASKPSDASAVTYGWTEKHAMACFSVHRSLWSCVLAVTRVTSEPGWRPDASAAPGKAGPCHDQINALMICETTARIIYHVHGMGRDEWGLRGARCRR